MLERRTMHHQLKNIISTSRHHSYSGPSGEMTPPLTPATSSDDLKPLGHAEEDEEPSSQFPNYLRAIYPFHPPCDSDTDTVTLPLNQGDIILIHSVHSNGWADGTLLDTAHRGWLPTNYCEAYHAEPVQTLLNSLTNFWDSASEGGDGTVAVVHGHNLTQGLVAGVRCLLDQTDCLNRDTELISRTVGHSGLRRHRKALLSELSNLVKFFKNCDLTTTITATNDAFLTETDLSQLVLKTFHIIVRAVKFYDVWEQQTSEPETLILATQPLCNIMHEFPVPPTPPIEQTSFSSEQSSFGPVESDVAREAAEIATTESTTTGINHDHNQPQQTRSSVTFQKRNSSLCISQGAPKCLYHRISWSVKPAAERNGKLASQRLVSANESFLSFLSAFLGIHLLTQSAVEVLVATQQAVNAGRALLTVTEAVWDRGLCKSKILGGARDAMYQKITQLVFAAQQIFAYPNDIDKDGSEPANRKLLADAALSCVSSATDCVDATRAALELIGDFEFETLDQSSTFTGIDFESDDFEQAEEEHDLTMVEDFPSPPDSNSQSPVIVSPVEQLTPRDLNKNLAPSPIPEESGTNTPSSRFSTSSIFQPPPSLTDGSSVGDASPLSIASTSRQFPPRDSSMDALPRTTSPVLSVRSSSRLNETWSATATDVDCSGSATDITDCCSSIAHSTVDGDFDELEADLNQTTFAHELIFNKEGQIAGGTLSALVERLTTSDSRPDHTFVSSFFLTFRLFTTPELFAESLVQRYRYIGENKTSAAVVRLRVYNVFKTWIESNWRKETDNAALPIMTAFAHDDLVTDYPSASARLQELIANLSDCLSPKTIKSRASLEQLFKQALPATAAVPTSAISKSQAALLKSWQQGGAKPSISDFEPLEIARQLTLKASNLFAAIQPDELLATEWTKKTGSNATNVRAMSTLSTDLTNLVADSVLQFDEHAKRAKVIKHWIKIANKCLELDNYDSLMAIICSLNSTPILRLKRTWDCVGSKAKVAFENLKSVVDCSRNYTNLRQRLAKLVAPSLPFLGVYLTDLTFVEAGNACTRALPGSPASSAVKVINFDKHAKTAKIVFELQRFQTPYHLQEIPEFQAWIQDQFVQVRCSMDNGASPITKLYRRSCILEPKDQSISRIGSATQIPRLFQKEGEFMGIHWK